MFVVIVGNMFGAKTIHGSFSNHDRAVVWAENHSQGQHWEVVPLTKVETTPICQHCKEQESICSIGTDLENAIQLCRECRNKFLKVEGENE